MHKKSSTSPFSECKHVWIRVGILNTAQSTGIGDTVEIVAPRAKVGITNEEEDKEAGCIHEEKQWDADYEQDALPPCIPFAECNIGQEDNGCRDPEYQSTNVSNVVNKGQCSNGEENHNTDAELDQF